MGMARVRFEGGCGPLGKRRLKLVDAAVVCGGRGEREEEEGEEEEGKDTPQARV